ncbi:hypothetical protein ACFYT3_18955 [Nocardia amikacinitolerans]|uniref:hypothetical protein n=1 Tax=Nocardia amikacinitolerans TaxID=756689 RepID=UPI003676881D
MSLTVSPAFGEEGWGDAVAKVLGADALGSGLRLLPMIGGVVVGALLGDRLPVAPYGDGVSAGGRPRRRSAEARTRWRRSSRPSSAR